MRLDAFTLGDTFSLMAQYPRAQREAAQALAAELRAAGLHAVEYLEDDGASAVVWRTSRRVSSIRRHVVQLFWESARATGLCPPVGAGQVWDDSGAWESFRRQVLEQWAQHLAGGGQ